LLFDSPRFGFAADGAYSETYAPGTNLVPGTLSVLPFLRKRVYSESMGVALEFNPSAFKHGVSEADIRYAFDTPKHDGYIDEDDPDAENKHLLIGFDRNANLLEIYYNVIDEDTLNVFHAMRCRNIYLHLVKPEE
jgi:uncharacterized DUF497 family protein